MSRIDIATGSTKVNRRLAAGHPRAFGFGAVANGAAAGMLET
jgi:hypothetical protein